MSESLEVRRLRGATILKILFTGSVLGLTALCAALSLPACLGVEVLKWNGEYVTGLPALAAGPFIGAFVGFVLAAFLSLPVYVGLRLYSLFAPLTLEYVPTDDAQSSAKSVAQ